MAVLTLGQAARQTRVSKSVIWKAIQRNKLAATRSPSGAYQIDEAELQRYLDACAPAVRVETIPDKQSRTDVLELAEAIARARVSEELLVLLRAQLAEMTAQRDRWERRFDQLKLVSQDGPKRRSWWLPWRRAS